MWLWWSFHVGGLSLWCYAWAGQILMEGRSGLWGGCSVWGVWQLCVWWVCVVYMWVVGVGWVDTTAKWCVGVCLINSDTMKETRGALSFLSLLSSFYLPPSLPPFLPPFLPTLPSSLPSLPPSLPTLPLGWVHQLPYHWCGNIQVARRKVCACFGLGLS